MARRPKGTDEHGSLASLLPPLARDEYEALAADIAEHGVLSPIVVDEQGNILDGRHRYQIDPNAPRRIVRGLTEAEKRAYVYRTNLARRNLSPEQKREVMKGVRETAMMLRAENPRKNTQARIAALLGVAQPTVAAWLSDSRTIISADNSSHPSEACTAPPDARVKINPKHRAIIVARADAGDPQEQIAADYGVTRRTISKIIRAERKAAELKAKLAEAASKHAGHCGIICGDLRVEMAKLPDASVDLILTDPPYDDSGVGLSSEIAALAATKLVPGGWMLLYFGQSHLGRLLSSLEHVEGLEYGWVFCVVHSGGDRRIRKFRLQNSWKPVVGFYRPPLTVAWDWFPDLVSGGKEKAHHPWQQAVAESAHFIRHLSPANGIVLDPCCGSGTTLIAARQLGRRYIGIEMDPQAAETARARLEAGDDAAV